MERRVLLAVTLSFLVLVIYQRWLGPPPPPLDPTVGTPVGDQRSPGPDSLSAISPGATAEGNSALSPVDDVAAPPTVDDVDPVVFDTRQRTIVVESEFIRAEFDNRGGTLLSWKLKDYRDDAGDPVEIVPQGVVPEQTRPFTLVVPDDPRLTQRLSTALFQPSTDSLRLGTEPGMLSFEYEDSSGLRVQKSFVFHPAADQPYVVLFEASVTTAAGRQPLTTAWGPALGGVRAETSRLVFQQLPGAVLYGRPFEDGILQEVDVYRAAPADVPDRPTYDGQLDLVGVDNHYFVAVALPGAQQSRVDYRPVSTIDLEHDLVEFDITLSPDAGPLPFFVGPKDFDLLAVVHPDLVRTIDFGFLSVIVVPLHRSLKWIYGFLGNYGWSIILLTVLINIVIFPLRHKSVVSMRKMQELQPEMKAIQARYANLKATDPAKQKMNQEVMELYRRHGANPASGCLPILATMPILIAFYRLLSMAVELRGAPFVGWITDLSVQDPFYVTPLIMGVSMVYQQRLQPAGPDPTQRRIMMLMPVMFTVMFLWAPSGLVIYWLTSNLLGIGQQVVTNRISGPPRERTVRPPAERQTKRGDSATDTKKEQAGRNGPVSRPARSGKGSRRSRGRK